MSRSEALPPAIESVVFDAAEIGRTVARLAAAIANENVGEPITLLGVLKGALFFMADLARALPAELDVRIDTIAVASYGNATRSSGEVRLLKDASESIEGNTSWSSRISSTRASRSRISRESSPTVARHRFGPASSWTSRIGAVPRSAWTTSASPHPIHSS